MEVNEVTIPLREQDILFYEDVLESLSKLLGDDFKATIKCPTDDVMSEKYELVISKNNT